ncbi:HAD family phosphatase [Cellulomonas sp. PhB150]|uniref:HAD family hydrolase n=1 Tax=Cellulomonas sp. PhB150 TaxID=2485188 RepID=UPI000F49B5E0|nr:haloacid dehalogenase-like hydrolase [Cellulomonas sp. PhB150]ROS30634.1 phosphoserine phosphatase [Cellulomonas sp. PhB150]
MTTGIVFFDVDGTLIPGVASSAVHIARRLGHAAELLEAEDLWDRGLMSGPAVERLDAIRWAGSPVAQVRAWLADLPLVDGIAETVAWCVEHDLQPVLATLAWQAVGDELCDRFGFLHANGARVAQVDGRYTGEVELSIDEHGKLEHARRAAAAAGIPLADCVAVGDGRSDVPLFGAVGLAVGFNANVAASAAAHRTVVGGDLRAVIPVIEEWLGR